MWYLVINKSRFKDSIKTTSISSRYRDGHPQYCERNRMLQKQRDAKRRAKHQQRWTRYLESVQVEITD